MELVCNVGEDVDVFGAGLVVLGVEEQVTDSVLTLSRKFDTKVALRLTAEKGVWDTSHDTSTVAVTSVCTDGTTVGHVAEEEASIGDDLVSGLALDLAHKTDTTGILLVVWVVEALGSGHGTGPERGGTLYLIVTAGLEVVGRDGFLVDGSGVGVELVNEANLTGVFSVGGDGSHNRHCVGWVEVVGDDLEAPIERSCVYEMR